MHTNYYAYTVYVHWGAVHAVPTYIHTYIATYVGTCEEYICNRPACAH